jgi:phosphoglycolate phosphatase-like HAD superfamily hydrolase
MLPKAVIFDFDGVILESVDIKTRAFKEMFSDRPEHLEEIVKLHLDNGGMSRFEKFKIIFREFLGEPMDERKLQQLGAAFSDIVYREILQCPFVAGAQEFLAKHSSTVPLFIASGTPQQEIEDIVEQRHLRHHFRAIYGAPMLKPHILGQIIEGAGIRPHQACFVGDALGDHNAARAVSMPFVGRLPRGERIRFPSDGLLGIVTDLTELEPLLNHLAGIGF